MRVVVASPFVPWPLENGGAIRNYNLLRHAARDVEIDLLAVSSGNDAPDTQAALSEIVARAEILPRSRPSLARRWLGPKIERWFASAALRERLTSLDSSGAVDLFELHELPVVRNLPRAHNTPVMVHHHKIETDLAARLAGSRPNATERFDAAKLARLEADAARRYRHHLTCSDEDRAVLLGRYPDLDVCTLPSGYDDDFFTPDDTERDAATILFLGSMSYGPNVDGVLWFTSEILPLIHERVPQARLRIVGRDPVREVRALASEKIEVTGAVDDVRPALRSASLLAVPLRVGGGTRLKIVEGMGTATPLVSTTIGAEGLGLNDPDHLRLGDSPAAFATAVIELLSDPAGARELGRRGREVVSERFRWPDLAARLVDHWRRVA
ncbi:MAG: glycosyltransferase family 4 protein, partial [Planctomycetota bacterium]